MKGRGQIVGWIAALAIQGVAMSSPAQTALRVTTEYRYPTRYEVRGGQIFIGPNGSAVVQRAVFIPTDFETREVGMTMSSEAVVSPMGHGSITISSLSQPSRSGNTDLMLAAVAGDLEKVRSLLQKGVIVNARNYYGTTALMGAAAGGFDDVVRVLLAKSAYPNSKSNTGTTPLMLAARGGHAGVARLLIQAGAKVNESDMEGISPLMYAVESGGTDTVKLLIQAGAKVDSRDKRGTTPSRLAVAGKRDDILLLLTQAASGK